MSIFTIADLHLPGAEGAAKSMDVFGRRWANSQARLERNWRAVVGAEDAVVIPGDISWAMSLDEAREDFAFIDSLPGTKYIGKGNHDFWWATASKMNAFFADNSFKTLNILYNNAYKIGGAVICGARGWFFDEASQKTVGDTDWQKIVNRETMRLEMSIKAAEALICESRPHAQTAHISQTENETPPPIIAFLHFPPIWNGSAADGLLDVLWRHGVKKCYFGHIHSEYAERAPILYKDMEFRLISADHLEFCPQMIDI